MKKHKKKISIQSEDDALHHIQEGHIEDAVKILNSFLIRHHASHDMIMRVIKKIIKANRPDLAWNILQRIIQYGPSDHMESYLKQAELLFQFNPLDSLYLKAINRKEISLFIQCLFGEYLNRHYRGHDAIAVYEKARATLQDNLRLSLGHAIALEQANRRHDAKKIYDILLPYLDSDILTKAERVHIARAWCDFIGRTGDIVTAIYYLDIWFEEWHQQCQNHFKASHIDAVLWDNSQPKKFYKDKTLAIFGLAGFGDQIHFLRYAHEAKKIFRHVHLYVKAPLISLFEESRLADKIFPYDKVNNIKGEFDFYQHNFNMIRMFNINYHTIKPSKPYLKPAQHIKEQWQEKIKALHIPKNKKKIAICWSGDTNNPMHYLRRLTLHNFIPLLKSSHITFFNIQKNSTADEDILLQEHNVYNFKDDLQDFHQTAGLLSQMDAVICCDTSVNHLSGAMGLKTFCLIAHFPEFRWLLPCDHEDSILKNLMDDERYFRHGDEHSPWYQDMVLIRQSKPYQWEDDIKNLITQHLSLK